MLKRTVCNLRDEEVGGLEMVTTDADRVLRKDGTETDLKRYVG